MAPDSSEEAQRGVVLAQCFSGVDKGAADSWFLGHFARFVDASRPLLSPDEQKQLDEARAAAK